MPLHIQREWKHRFILINMGVIYYKERKQARKQTCFKCLKELTFTIPQEVAVLIPWIN